LIGEREGKSVGAVGGSVDHRRWYAVHTLPHKEEFAEINLNRQGFSTFTPRSVKSVRHARQFRIKEQAFFPRYVFVALDIQRQMWRSVNGTFGVVSLVTSGGRPVALPRGIVEHFIELADERGIMNFGPRLQVGGRVEILSGPFASLIGTLKSLDAAGRVKVLLELLGGEVPVTTRVDAVLPVS
jgi:transcription termination/antitermination protein NusG